MSGGGKTTGPVFVSRSARAGLLFPVGRIHRYMKERTGKRIRVGPTAAVCMASVLEYLLAEVFEQATTMCQRLRAKRMNARHLQLATKSDEELDALFENVIIAGGGVVPHIHKALLTEQPSHHPFH